MTPSWWMPDSWAKALAPTMALFGCTGKPVMPGHELAGRHDLGGVDAAVAREEVLARAYSHHDLFQ